MLYVIAMGFDIESAFGGRVETFAAIGLFMAIANLALVVPSTAGGVGPFNFFGAATLVALGVDEAEAGAYVLTAHIALLLPVTLLGLLMAVSDHMSIKTLLSRTRLSEAGERPEAPDAPNASGVEVSSAPTRPVS